VRGRFGYSGKKKGETLMGRLSGEKRIALSRGMIQRLNEMKREWDLSFDQFKIAISAPFTSQTLYHAMQGRPLWQSNYEFLAEFVRKHTRQPAAVVDGKSRSAGQKDFDEENNGETPKAAGTVRGSR
jgi:hypothetical protein